MITNNLSKHSGGLPAVVKMITEKEKNQEKIGLKPGKKTFILGFAGEITSDNFGNEFLNSLETLLELDVQILILAKAEEKFQKQIGLLYEKFENKFLVLADTEENLSTIYSVSDSVLLLKPDDDSLMDILYNSTVPILLNNNNMKMGLINDFDPLREKGNSFFVKGANYAFILESVLRAKETFRFVYDWGVLKTHCVNTYNSVKKENLKILG